MTDAERIAELEEEVAFLRRELGQVLDVTSRHDLKLALRLQPKPVEILLRLYAAKGRVVLRQQIMDLLSEDAGENTVRTHMRNIRKAIGDGAIVAVWSEGYRLTPAGMAIVARILGHAQASRAA